MVFNDNIKFYGTYRPYQQRVLDNLTTFLDNEKIHIVAAPGSGKTTLGLELIKRLNNASLILTPSIVIREQWIHRFSNGFLKNEKEKDEWISNNLKNPKPIICITYQALYSAFKKEKNSENIEEFNEEFNDEEIDFADFDLIEALRKNNIKTICLDECHHLKSEWWRVLEYIVKQIDGCQIIALTATPPYDASNQDWQRYIDLCGPIDEEIFVPELIKDKNLCPHQDYVYFSYPTENEEKEIMNLYSKSFKVFNKYRNDSTLLNLILENNVISDYINFKKVYYGNEEYYDSLIIYLLDNNITISNKIKRLINYEALNITHFEILLQNVLFDDSKSYSKDTFFTSLKKELVSLGLIFSHKVHLIHNERINKKITMSLSKLESIKNIVNHEYNNMKDDLRCLILTDYVKLKNKNDIGNIQKEINSFGTIPIFEYLRRENVKNICCLSGAVCILPSICIPYIEKEFTYEHLSDKDFIELNINNTNRKQMVLLVTRLFQDGIFNVLIGTKSLLGEGWDSPCINTLIMASFIGSYVLSNQMRGRAIRSDKNNLNKKANVWHLVCLNPFDYHFSYDYYNLEKRFSTFVGIDIEKQCIENGMERLGIKKVPYNKIEAHIINSKSLNEATDRNKVKEIWNTCIEKSQSIEKLTNLTVISKKRLNYDLSFFNNLTALFLSIILLIVNFDFYLNLKQTPLSNFLIITITAILGILFTSIAIIYLLRLLTQITPKIKLKTVGRATLNSLRKTNNIISKNVKVKTETHDKNNVSINLINATTYEQNVFSNCIMQIFSGINQPRYLLAKPKLGIQRDFYVVPDIFKKNKDMAKIFEKELAKTMGGFSIVFAKNETGKNIVIKAKKVYNFRYKNTEIKTKNILN